MKILKKLCLGIIWFGIANLAFVFCFVTYSLVCDAYGCERRLIPQNGMKMVAMYLLHLVGGAICILGGVVGRDFIEDYELTK